MLIIDKGSLVAEGRVDELFNPADMLIELQTTSNEEAILKLKQSAWRDLITVHDANRIMLKMQKDQLPFFNRSLVEMEIGVLSLHPRHSLEDYFLNLTTSNQHVGAFKN